MSGRRGKQSTRRNAGAFLLPESGRKMVFTEEQKKTGAWVRQISQQSYRGWKAFYHTKEWKKKRQEILKRDHRACCKCRARGIFTQAVTVHHVKHLSDVPELALTDSNLMSLCLACHDKEHPEKQYRRRKFETPERW